MAKKLTVDDLKARREKVDDKVRRMRTVLEAHKIERDKIFTPENRRRLTVEALREDEKKLRVRTHASLTKLRSEIVDGIGDAFELRSEWSRETALRNARFYQEYEGNPVTVEAQTKALLHELLEDVRRNGAERRAARYSPEDLAIEAAIAAEKGNVALLSVFSQEATNRQLAGLEKLAMDTALKKLATPELDEAQGVYADLSALTEESDALLSLWANPRSEDAISRESLARFNRKKAAERLVAEVEAEGRKQAEEKVKAQQRAHIPMPLDDPGEPPPQLAA